MSHNEQNILIVDDDPIVLKSLRDLLALRGIDADTAIGGREAIVCLDQKEYDLVLLDLQMPYVNGHDVMRHIKREQMSASVIVVSGETSFEAARDACSQGAYDFLRKPYATDELVITINNALNEIHLQKQNTLMQDQLRESERLHRYLVNTSPDIIYMLDRDGHFTYINDRIETLLGYNPKELIGKHYSHLVYQRDLEAARYIFNERRVGERASCNVEIRLKYKDESSQHLFDSRTLPVELSSVGMYTSENNSRKKSYTGTYGVARDITERKIAEETINFQAHHDLLTNLPNRALLRDRLGLAISQAKREQEMLAVMFLDLDRFKNINDSLGHVIGDELLQQVSTRLKSCIREGDTLARFGGDEFTLLLPKIGNGKEDISKIAQKINEVLKGPFIINGNELYVSASIGISIFPRDGKDMDTLIKHADIAMYHVKDTGKNNFKFYSTDMTTPYFQNLSLETGIHKALENNEFQLVYQPQINIKSGEIVGVEALLRWHNPVHGLITPAEFIPFAEETGMIVEVGHWVLSNACAELKKWRDAGLPEIRMSINMSARQLADKNVIKYVSNVLRDYGIPGHCLEIEITENTIMSDMDSIIHKLKNISKRGVYVAIDDFGTGYSSLSYLHKLPIHTLKIDRTFIKEVNMKHTGKSIINTIAAMGKGLNLNVIAEGVETQQQLDYLQEIDCNEAQGFLFCKPLPGDVISQLLLQEPYAVPDANPGVHSGRHRTH